jgi:perosamine synthetase
MCKNDLLCPISADFAEALRHIDLAACGLVCLVNDDQEVVGILTDGDVRRALLGGCSLGTPVIEYANRHFFWMPAGLPKAEYFESLFEKKYYLSQLLVLDEKRRFVDIVTLRDPDANLPVAAINLSGNELKYITQCIQSNWISSQGQFVKDFEKTFADFHEMPFALTTSSGTTALHLALLGIGLERGEEVIVPVSTFGATANAVVHAGGVPVFVDIDPDTCCIDPGLVKKAITPRTKAIIPVHLYGHPANMPEILKIASEHGLRVIEDCAESLGARVEGRLTGTMGDVACFSFFSNKVITTGEGGMVLTRDQIIHDRMRQFRDHGMSPARKYWHEYAGYNYRMTNIQAAIGLAQMERMDTFLEIRANLARRYEEQLSGLRGIELPRTLPGYVNIFWLYTIVVTERCAFCRDELMTLLNEKGIDSRPFFPALFHQPAYKDFMRSETFPVGLRMERDGLSLPTSNYLSLQDIDRICLTIREIVATGH